MKILSISPSFKGSEVQATFDLINNPVANFAHNQTINPANTALPSLPDSFTASPALASTTEKDAENPKNNSLDAPPEDKAPDTFAAPSAEDKASDDIEDKSAKGEETAKPTDSLPAEDFKKASANSDTDELKNCFAALSKSKAYGNLRMAKGREIQDGIFKMAEGASVLGALGTFCAGMINSGKAHSIYKKHYDVATGVIDSAKENAKDFAKIAEKGRKGNKLLGVSLMFACITGLLEYLNGFLADKTANERGFKTSNEVKQMSKTNSDSELLNRVDEIYNEVIK